MGKRTGNPRGRPPGARNRRTVEAETVAKANAAAIAEALPGAFTGDAHALLMTVYKDPSMEWPLRLDAAKKAIHFEKPALAQVDQAVDAEHVHRVISDRPMTVEAWEQNYGTPHAGPGGAGHDD